GRTGWFVAVVETAAGMISGDDRVRQLYRGGRTSGGLLDAAPVSGSRVAADRYVRQGEMRVARVVLDAAAAIGGTVVRDGAVDDCDRARRGQPRSIRLIICRAPIVDGAAPPTIVVAERAVSDRKRAARVGDASVCVRCRAAVVTHYALVDCDDALVVLDG